MTASVPALAPGLRAYSLQETEDTIEQEADEQRRRRQQLDRPADQATPPVKRWSLTMTPVPRRRRPQSRDGGIVGR
ncbi:hypothetical protein [Streptomyces sp. NPDC097981]|uniref:hypothetical protein n=1 Tax=Streptomyces sp. NPDC097981 TaxID=3155428 RepID=UPI00333445A6